MDVNLSAVAVQWAFSLGNSSYHPLGDHKVWEVVVITLVTASLSLVTVTGNILVVLSFKFNRQLKTVNNYFLLSLAYADLIIGIISMNLYSTYIILGRWALGPVACDIWLALDYVASNASVMNLLVISFDRYFSVTRPLTYRVKRTPRRAVIMIVLAWSISVLLWAPAILLWQYVVGQRTVKPGRCAIQFLSEPGITFGTAIAAFYLPVTIMTVLYWRIYSETKQRAKELAALQGTGNSWTKNPASGQSGNGSWGRRWLSGGPQRLSNEGGESSAFIRGCEPQLQLEVVPDGSSRASSNNAKPLDPGGKADSRAGPSLCCLQRQAAGSKPSRQKSSPTPAKDAAVSVRKAASRDSQSGLELELEQLSFPKPGLVTRPGRDSSREHRQLLQPEKPLSTSPSSKDESSASHSIHKAKSGLVQRKRIIIKEKKAAKTLSAILLAFIVTWSPYNIMVLVSAFCNDCVPKGLWQLGYWLCYINSTVNPMCYALCNREFRITFKMLLLCRWGNRKRTLKPPARQAAPS
ncbi:muscarinic acetylcholine receptor M1-like [Carcharodon carcharias]|uniref:muscarinic acetylcholine receptor M1-like n=1 Tax=Carcharodon carcharias TaxID=13397 RepID=UPI001B7E6FA4|nr:muscarinic acetylcholine receptor M1-like [Carcharodon carcharias]